MEFRHHHLTLQDVTPAEHIVHGVTTLTSALCDTPAIACDNQLAAIQALCQAIHRWDQLTLPLSKLAQVTPPHPTPTRQHSAMFPMRSQATVKPHSSFPRVVIQTPNAAPSAPRVKSTKEQYEPVARHTRSKVPHTVDPPPPRVDKAMVPANTARIEGTKGYVSSANSYTTTFSNFPNAQSGNC